MEAGRNERIDFYADGVVSIQWHSLHFLFCPRSCGRLLGGRILLNVSYTYIINKITYIIANCKQPHTSPSGSRGPGATGMKGRSRFRFSHVCQAKNNVGLVFPRGIFKGTTCPLGSGGVEVFGLFLLLLLEKKDSMGARARLAVPRQYPFRVYLTSLSSYHDSIAQTVRPPVGHFRL
jgi:hypothetical protein